MLRIAGGFAHSHSLRPIGDERNSRVTRVQPVFEWLKKHGDEFWPARLVSLAHGVEKLANCGPIERVHLDPEFEVAATPPA